MKPMYMQMTTRLNIMQCFGARSLLNTPMMAFSVVSRRKKVNALANMRRTKYKLKTKKAFQKRIRVVSVSILF